MTKDDILENAKKEAIILADKSFKDGYLQAIENTTQTLFEYILKVKEKIQCNDDNHPNIVTLIAFKHLLDNSLMEMKKGKGVITITDNTF